MLVLKAYKYRLYPSVEQATYLNQTFGACRKVYNVLLDQAIKTYEAYKLDTSKPKPKVSGFDFANQIPGLKASEDLSWLAKYSYNALQQKTLDLGKAYSSFFNSKGKIGYPKFRNRFLHNSFRLVEGNFRIKDNLLTLPKLKIPIKLSLSRKLPSNPSQITITKTSSGEYYASFLCEVEQAPIATGTKTIGIDLGISTLAVTSDGQNIINPKNYLAAQARLAITQRRLSHKVKGSKNRNKARLVVASLHQKIANRRNDFLHKLTTKLVEDNRAIVIENLAVSNMAKNHNLAKHVLDAGFSIFRQQLMYKVINSQHTNLVIADRWEPSTQRCSCCGVKSPDKVKLGVKAWTCLICGAKHDRDFNASKNLENIAYRLNVSSVLLHAKGSVILAERMSV